MSLPDAGPLGILGGTFDPVHRGHLQLARDAQAALALTALRWVPAGQPGHRQPPVASAVQRAAMVDRVIAGHPGWTLDRRQVDCPDASFTVPLLESLRAETGPQRPIFVIVGADAFAGLTGWHRWPELLTLAHLAVAERPAFALDPGTWPAPLAALFRDTALTPEAAARRPAGGIVRFAMTPTAVSATAIRARLRRGQPVGNLLPSVVVDYIRTHHLYLTAHDPD